MFETLNKMSVYSIKDMEMLSNVKAHTIRIWEQRYHLFTPERTDTNIRYYNDDQLKKLLNVCTLIEHGVKISHIAKLTNEQIAERIDSIINNLKTDNEGIEALINQALSAIAVYDEAAFEHVFSRCREKMSITDCYVKLIYPLLIRTGLMWSKDDVIPAQEHFLSNLIRKKLFAAIDSVSIPDNADQTWVLFLHEHEKHEIGLLFASYILRVYGKKVIYLGQEVPLNNLLNVITECHPTHVCTFFVRNYPPAYINTLIKTLVDASSHLVVCVSGKEEIIANIPATKRIVILDNLQSLIQIINDRQPC